MSPDVAKQPTVNPRRGLGLRFGLRSLLLIITAAAVWMASVLPSARRQQEVVQSVQEAGGRIHFAYEKTQTSISPPPFAADWFGGLGLHLFHRVEGIEVTAAEFDGADDVLRQATRLSYLQWLAINSPHFTDRGADGLANLTELERLELHAQRFSNQTLQRLAGMSKLESLSIISNQIDDEGIIELAKLPALERLTLRATYVTDEGLSALGEVAALRKLTLFGRAHYGVPGCSITSSAVEPLAQLKQLDALTILNLGVGDMEVQDFAVASHLARLTLDMTEVTAKGAKELQESIPNTRVFVTNGGGSVYPGRGGQSPVRMKR
ncbi:MAG: hypothetical protein QGG36_27070 [Pirellulaceae bacterium]|jgi:hypothetical protein|nr:hypothetical protein [Pirellulaceae bacterium]